MPTEHGILFSSEMIRALLAGTKRVTRRLDLAWLKKAKRGNRLWVRETFVLQAECDGDDPPFTDGRPVLRLTDEEGSESWEQPHYRATDPTPELSCSRGTCDGDGPCCHWRPSIHMPRWASRILLECEEDARLERLQDITEEDAIAEGIDPFVMTAQDVADMQISDDPPHLKELARLMRPGSFPARFEFEMLWNSLYMEPGTRWQDNPEVVVIRFKRL